METISKFGISALLVIGGFEVQLFIKGNCQKEGNSVSARSVKVCMKITLLHYKPVMCASFPLIK